MKCSSIVPIDEHGVTGSQSCHADQGGGCGALERDVIQRRSLHEEVSARLEADIHTGRYAEGDQLPSERELMERYGVGRPAVREALLSLREWG